MIGAPLLTQQRRPSPHPWFSNVSQLLPLRGISIPLDWVWRTPFLGIPHRTHFSRAGRRRVVFLIWIPSREYNTCSLTLNLAVQPHLCGDRFPLTGSEALNTLRLSIEVVRLVWLAPDLFFSFL